MRKVPYLIIGSGRLASHWARYFSELGLDYATWSRRDNSSEELALWAEQARTIILAINDDALQTFVTRHAFLDNNKLCHCSGSRYFPEIYGAHPLMSFATPLYDLTTYQAIGFIVDEPCERFTALFPELSNHHHAIKSADKAYYHALCVMSGNFTVLIWQHVFAQMQAKLQIPAEFIMPYLTKIIDNLRSNPQAAATGPFSRGDTTTINANLRALADDPYIEVYRAFVAAEKIEGIIT